MRPLAATKVTLRRRDTVHRPGSVAFYLLPCAASQRYDVERVGNVYTEDVRSLSTFTAAILWTTVLIAQPTIDGTVELNAADGTAVSWDQWIAANGPAAVLFWASWTPDADQILTQAAALEQTAQQRQLQFVVVSVQEELDAARARLDEHVRWLHDRHGRLLRRLRILEIPSLVIIDPEGEVLSRLEPSPDALERWQSE